MVSGSALATVAMLAGLSFGPYSRPVVSRRTPPGLDPAPKRRREMVMLEAKRQPNTFAGYHPRKKRRRIGRRG